MLKKIKTSYLFLVFLSLVAIFLWTSVFNISSSGKDKKNSQIDNSIGDGIMSFCNNPQNAPRGKENCYSSEFRKLAEKSGPEISFSVLHYLQQLDRDAVGCHLIAHSIGKGSFKKDGDNWRGLIQKMETSCNYGAIHGVLESYVGSLPDKSLKKDVIPSICGENPLADCNHIIGHLLLVQTDANVKKALDLCEVLSDPRQNSFCISGVFMEYQTALNLVDHELVPETWLNWAPRLGELEKLCRSFDGKYASGCWEELPHIALVKFQNDPKKMFDLCSTAQVPDGAKRCKRHSLGIIGASMNFDLSKMKSVCSIPQKDDSSFEEECYPAIVSSSLSTIPDAVPQAVTFCSSLDDKFQPSCFSMVGIMSFSNPKIKDALPSSCKNVKKEMKNYCLGISSYSNQNLIKTPNN
jgi:hypothetical protein